MKASELKIGKTYVGAYGRRRYLERFAKGDVIYDTPEGDIRWCSKQVFARWAKREATPEEAAPPWEAQP